MSPAEPTGPLTDPRVLVGTWQLSRTIQDRLGDLGGLVEGHLELTKEDPERLRWEEQGTWRRPTGDVAVRRGLLVVRRATGWWVLFEDGREFHPWAPGVPVVHDCRPDTYRGTVTGSPAGWSVTWEVTGPAKDYLMLTRLRPAAD